MKSPQLDINKVAKKLTIPVSRWPGNCYALACAMVEQKLVRGVAIYGAWLGPVSENAPVFGKRARLPFQRHGWIKLKEPKGWVVDPTRWVFENVKPYIYVGPSDYYDEAGDSIRAMLQRPFPKFNPEHRRAFKPSTQEALAHCVAFAAGEPTWDRSQLFWLANLPYDAHGQHVAAVYAALVKSVGSSAIPIDNIMRCEREHGVSLSEDEPNCAAPTVCSCGTQADHDAKYLGAAVQRGHL